MGRVDERRPAGARDRLDLDPPPEPAQALGEPVRGPALGVGAGEPALERAQLAHDLHSPCRVHERGIYGAAATLLREAHFAE